MPALLPFWQWANTISFSQIFTTVSNSFMFYPIAVGPVLAFVERFFSPTPDLPRGHPVTGKKQLVPTRKRPSILTLKCCLRLNSVAIPVKMLARDRNLTLTNQEKEVEEKGGYGPSCG